MPRRSLRSSTGENRSTAGSRASPARALLLHGTCRALHRVGCLTAQELDSFCETSQRCEGRHGHADDSSNSARNAHELKKAEAQASWQIAQERLGDYLQRANTSPDVSSTTTPSTILRMRSAYRQVKDAWVAMTRVVSDSPASSGEEVEDLIAGCGVQVTGGLVSQDNRWPLDDRPGDGHALLFSTREFVGIPMLFAGETDFLQGLTSHIRIRLCSQFQGKKYIFKGGKCGQKVEELKDKTEPEPAQVRAPLLPEKFQILPFDLYAPFRRVVEAGDQIEKRALSRSALAEESDNFTRAYFKAAASKGRCIREVIRVVLPKVDNADYRFSH